MAVVVACLSIVLIYCMARTIAIQRTIHTFDLFRRETSEDPAGNRARAMILLGNLRDPLNSAFLVGILVYLVTARASAWYYGTAIVVLCWIGSFPRGIGGLPPSGQSRDESVCCRRAGTPARLVRALARCHAPSCRRRIAAFESDRRGGCSCKTQPPRVARDGCHPNFMHSYAPRMGIRGDRRVPDLGVMGFLGCGPVAARPLRPPPKLPMPPCPERASSRRASWRRTGRSFPRGGAVVTTHNNSHNNRQRGKKEEIAQEDG